jgi:hypothetical protein
MLIAAGIVPPGAKIGMIDTENGRGSMYADSPGIMRAMPQGYDIIELAPPFHPRRYIAAIDAFEEAGYAACIIDSGSHSWEGEGGCSDIAEKNKGRWNQAKLWNKRLVATLLYSKMHIIVCLRAREKSKIVILPGGKEETISLGIQPICEKGFPFEMLLSFFVEEKTHLASVIKCPEPLAALFPEPRLLTKADGERIREWNDAGSKPDELDRILKQARAIARGGLADYQKFFGKLTAAQKKALSANPQHAENKELAMKVDEERTIPIIVNDWPEPNDYAFGQLIDFEGIVFTQKDDMSGWRKVEQNA